MKALSSSLDKNYHDFKKDFYELLPDFKQNNPADAKFEGDDRFFSRCLEKMKDAYEVNEVDDTDLISELINILTPFIDTEKKYIHFININIWKLLVFMRLTEGSDDHGKVETNTYDETVSHTAVKIISPMQQALDKFSSRTDIEQIFINMLFLSKELAFFRCSLTKTEKTIVVFLEKLIATVKKFDPFMGLILGGATLRFFCDKGACSDKDQEQYISLMFDGIDKIDYFNENFMERFADLIKYIIAEDLDGGLLTFFIFKMRQFFESNNEFLYYRLIWTVMGFYSDNLTPDIVKQLVANIITDFHLMNKQKQGISNKALKRLKKAIEFMQPRYRVWLPIPGANGGSHHLVEIKDPSTYQNGEVEISTLENVKGEYLDESLSWNLTIELQVIYIQKNYSDKNEVIFNCELIDTLLIRGQFEALKLFRKIAFLTPIYKIIINMSLPVWEKLISINDSAKDIFTLSLMGINQKLSLKNIKKKHLLNKERVLFEKYPDYKSFQKKLQNHFLYSYQYIWCLDSGLFFLGPHNKKFYLPMVLREIILRFYLLEEFRGMPLRRVVDIIKIHSQQKKPISPDVQRVAASVTQHFANYFQGPIDKSHITGLLCEKLSKSIGEDTLVFNKCLEALLYKEVKSFADQNRYLNKPAIVSLVKNAMEKYQTIQNIMAELSWNVGRKLALLDLSIYQLTTALEIMWVTHFNHLPVACLSSHRELVNEMETWILSRLLNPAKLEPKHRLSLFKLIICVKFGKIGETRKVFLTRHDLATNFFPSVLKSIQKQKTNKRKSDELSSQSYQFGIN